MSPGVLLLGLALAAALALLGALGFWLHESASLKLSIRQSRIDPILGARDRIAIYDGAGPFIPLPDRLKTRAEMVDWMTRDLPRLVAEERKTGV